MLTPLRGLFYVFLVETVTSLAILEGPFLLSLTENSENNTCIITFLRHPIYSDYGDMSLPLEGIFFFFWLFAISLGRSHGIWRFPG